MTDSPVILALDQSSTRTGWCRGRPEGPVAFGSYTNPRCGSPKSYDYGLAFQHYADWLDGMLDGVEIVAFEQPVRPGGYLHLHTARLLYSIATCIEWRCLTAQVRAMEANTREMKKLFYGNGGKKPTEFQAMCLAREWGLEPGNGDEADAAGVFIVTIKNRFPEAFKLWANRKQGALL